MTCLGLTLALARERRQGLLFIGGWGWDYEMELRCNVDIASWRQAGFAFFNRHA